MIFLPRSLCLHSSDLSVCFLTPPLSSPTLKLFSAAAKHNRVWVTLTRVRGTAEPSESSVLCTTCYFPCLRAQFSCVSLTNLSCTSKIQFHKLPAEGCPGLLAQHLCLTATVFPCSNTWWLHSEFLQDFGHTTAQESQTTGWRMAVHQQCWHMDKPDSTGKHASSRGQEVDCYHFRHFSVSRRLGQLTDCGYSQLSVSQAWSPLCTDSHPPDPHWPSQLGSDSARGSPIPASAPCVGVNSSGESSTAI